ncbi:MAG: SDR family oxidoreductase [Pseudomonadota bacterium]
MTAADPALGAEACLGIAGKTALVTGGSRGIGRAIADALASAGADVTTCGRGPRPDDLGASIAWVTADMAHRDGPDVLISAAGVPDILVNNAGIQVEETLANTDIADLHAVIATNCTAVALLCQMSLPTMADRGGGAIVNIGSISARHADPGLAIYNASKAFVHGLTRSIAVDHGPAVRCNAVAPGWIMTAMADDAFALAREPDAAQRDALARTPAGRFGKPSDIARTVLWLVSDAAAFVTGQVITVDGGLTAASPLRPALF